MELAFYIFAALCCFMAGAFAERRINQKHNKHMAKTLDETLEEVRALRTVADGLAALTRDIKARLDAALTGVLTPEQQAKVDAIFAEVTQEKEEIAVVITENTPAG